MFLNEIAAKCVTDGVGVLGTTIFLSMKASLPDSPTAKFLTIIETGGSGAARTHTSALARPTAQFVGVAPSYLDARALAVAAYNSMGGLDGLHNVVLSGVVYVSITSRQEPTDLGPDEIGRARVAFNIDAEKQRS